MSPGPQPPGSAPSPGPVHLPTVTAVMMGDTKRERRTLLVTERHCWHPDRLLLRLWPSTSRRSKTGEGLCRDLSAQPPGSGSLPSPSSAQAAAAGTPPPPPQGQAATTAQVSLENTPGPPDPFLLSPAPSPTSPGWKYPHWQRAVGRAAERVPARRGCGESGVAQGHAVGSGEHWVSVQA